MRLLSIKVITFIIFFVLNQLNAQNISNTLGTAGIFSVKDNTNTFLSISQSNGNITFISETAGSQRGSLFKGSDRFLHTYYGSGTDGSNTFLGINSGNFTMGGIGSEGSYNTAVGNITLNSNTTGNTNSAFGYQSLYSNTTGSRNSAFGGTSLYNNTTGVNNSAFGDQSLYSNTTGVNNSAFGAASLYSNITGYFNSAFGRETLLYNTTGNRNSAFGNGALRFSSTGNFNTALGYDAGSNIITGSNNIAIGYNAQVPINTANNQVRIGDTFITYAGVQVAWTVTSDKRWKDNIQPSPLGLDFISKLNPVSYTRNNDEKQKTEFGLIAQELEEVLKQLNIENTGMLTIDDNGYYHLRYNDLLAPIIKSIQELKSENDLLKAQNQELMKQLLVIEKIQTELAKLIKDNPSKDDTKFVNLIER